VHIESAAASIAPLAIAIGPAMRPPIRNKFDPLAAVPEPSESQLGRFVNEPEPRADGKPTQLFGKGMAAISVPIRVAAVPAP